MDNFLFNIQSIKSQIDNFKFQISNIELQYNTLFLLIILVHKFLLFAKVIKGLNSYLTFIKSFQKKLIQSI